ncbi:MAG: LLM class flavin-dependent oxidoreductase [Caulobacterales bacterium]
MRKRVWGELSPMPQDQLAQHARDLEAAGLEGIWAPQIFGAPFATLAAAAMATQNIKLGAGVAMAFTRSPLETACNALDLDLICNGRFVLGLGSSAANVSETAFGARYGKPLAHMREVVSAVRAMIAEAHTGSLGRFDGEYATMDLSHFRTVRAPLRSHIPIYLPAVFEKATAQAGEIADGLLGHPIWADAWIHNQVKDNLRAGLGRANKPRDQFDLNLMVFVAIHEDKRQAIEDSRANVAFYAKQYDRYFEAIGFGREATAIRAAAARNDFAAMSAACPDDMVEAIVLAGSADEVRKRMAQRAGFADSITPVVPHFGLPADKHTFYARALADTFYG